MAMLKASRHRLGPVRGRPKKKPGSKCKSRKSGSDSANGVSGRPPRELVNNFILTFRLTYKKSIGEREGIKICPVTTKCRHLGESYNLRLKLVK